MTTTLEDEWKNDEEFISWTMNRVQMTRQKVMDCDCWSSTWNVWSAGRAAGKSELPRPMSDAPKDGTTVRLFMTGFHMVTINSKGKYIEEWYPGPPTGWLPLLDDKEHQ